jgi:hypothetical protein
VATTTAGVAPSTGLVPAGFLASTADGLEVLALTLPYPDLTLDAAGVGDPREGDPSDVGRVISVVD